MHQEHIRVSRAQIFLKNFPEQQSKQTFFQQILHNLVGTG